MPRYESNDVSFDVPRDWEDRSVTAFAAPAKPGQTAPNLVITRDSLMPGEDVRGYADRQLVELAKRLSGFSLRKRQETTLAGLPAVELRFGWMGQTGPLEQRLVFVVTGKRMLSFTATMARSDASRLGPVFERILESVVLPEDAEG